MTKTRNFAMVRKPLVVNRQLGQVPLAAFDLQKGLPWYKNTGKVNIYKYSQIQESINEGIVYKILN